MYHVWMQVFFAEHGIQATKYIILNNYVQMAD